MKRARVTARPLPTREGMGRPLGPSARGPQAHGVCPGAGELGLQGLPPHPEEAHRQRSAWPFPGKVSPLTPEGIGPGTPSGLKRWNSGRAPWGPGDVGGGEGGKRKPGSERSWTRM